MPCEHEERLCETMLQSKYFIACELVKSACELENAREEIARLKKTIHVIVEEAAKREQQNARMNRAKKYGEMTNQEAEEAYDSAEPIPISPDKIEELVKIATSDNVMKRTNS